MKKSRSYLILALILGFFISVAFISKPLPDDEVNALGNSFLEAFKKKDFKGIKSLMPGPDEWRLLVPKQTEGLTDAQIMEKVDGNNVVKVQNHFSELHHEAQLKKIKIKELEFNHVVVQRYYEKPDSPVGLEVVFNYANFHGKFSIAAVKLNGKWFLLDIEDPSSAFETIGQM